MSREVLSDYDDGFGFTNSQREQLGYAAAGRIHGNLIYGQFVEPTTLGVGQLVRHADSADLLKTSEANVSTEGEANVTTASAVGSTYLHCAGLFDGKDWRGARGYISDGAGQGQSFYIANMIDGESDYVEVTVLSGNNRRDRVPGWKEALNTTSQFRLWFNGKFYQGDGNAGDRNAGFLLSEVIPTADYQPYGYVVAVGEVDASFDQGGTDISDGGLVIASSAGQVQGGGTSTANLRDKVGWGLAQTNDLDADELVSIDADVKIWSPSYAYNLAAEHSGNTVNIV